MVEKAAVLPMKNEELMKSQKQKKRRRVAAIILLFISEPIATRNTSCSGHGDEEHKLAQTKTLTTLVGTLTGKLFRCEHT